MLDVYKDFVENELAVPVISVQKRNGEFAGARALILLKPLWLMESLRRNIAQLKDFAKVLRLLLDKDKVKIYLADFMGRIFRLIGAIIMVHGDDRGLLPPRSS